MAKRILVPLDQSALAESVIPVVADAARGGAAAVRLLHVAPLPDTRVDPEGRVVAYADQERARTTCARRGFRWPAWLWSTRSASASPRKRSSSRRRPSMPTSSP